MAIAITLPGRRHAIVCIGDSGAGKSTTAIAMTRRGYSILADDVCPIDSQCRIQPGMPRAKVWASAAERLEIDTGPLDRVRARDAKFNLPLDEHFCAEPRGVSAFVWLVPGEVDEVKVSEVSGVEKFAVLRNNIYRSEYLLPLGLEPAYLAHVAQVAARTRVFKVVRPMAGFDLDPLLAEISDLYDRAELNPEASWGTSTDMTGTNQ